VSLKGAPQLRSRLRSLRVAFKDVGKRWGDRAAGKMRPAVPVRTGRLRRSFRVRASQRKSQVRAHYSAFFIDAGTKAHVIRPKSARTLAWQDGGRTVFAKRVNHPRVGARPFRKRAARAALSETAGAQALIDAWNAGA